MVSNIFSLIIFGFVFPLTSHGIEDEAVVRQVTSHGIEDEAVVRQMTSHGIENEAVVRQLTEVFGIEKVPESGSPRTARWRRSPPEYLTDLYRTVAYLDGISRRSNPYDADVVRGIPDKANVHQNLYFFDVSHISGSESVLEAEFHLFKLRHPEPPSSSSSVTSGSKGHDPGSKGHDPGSKGHDPRGRRPARDAHVIDLFLYEVIRTGNASIGHNRKSMNSDGDVIDDASLRLLHRRRIGKHQRPGWEVFNVSATVRRWVQLPANNRGFFVTTRSPRGHGVNEAHLRFAQRTEHHDSKQPVLIVFADDRTRHVTTEGDLMEDAAYKPPTSNSDLGAMRLTYVRFLNEGHRAEHGPLKRPRAYMSPAVHRRLLADEDGSNPARLRSRRSPPGSHLSSSGGRRGERRACQRQEMYVDFAKIGWSGWVISPKGYNAYRCGGACPFPLGQDQRPSNHATVQSIVHALKIAPDSVGTPCCVPNKLYSISLLYFDDDENVILKQYDEMVAASCGCH